MVPDIDPPPDYQLIGNKKSRRASDEEKAEIYRLYRGGFTYANLIEITKRSEDTLRKYVREVEAGDEATIRAQAEAYQHITSPAPTAPARSAAPSYDYDEDDYEEAPPLSRGLPPPPPMEEFDLDDLFEEDDDIDPHEEHALSKKLFNLLLQKKAVKGEDAVETAADIAKTYSMYPDYHSPQGCVEFLEGHDVKSKKASTISRLLFGWMKKEQGRPDFNPGPVPGYYPGGSPPGPPGYQSYHPQPWGAQPTQYGQQYQYYPYPPPPPQMPQGSDKGISKAELQQMFEKRDKQLHDHYTGVIKEMEEKRAAEKKDNELQQIIDNQNKQIAALTDEIREFKTNPQTAPPDGNYVSDEVPEYDEEGNLLRLRTTYTRLEDPRLQQVRDETQKFKEELKEEREKLSTALKDALAALSDAKTDTVRTKMEGEVKVLEQKAEIYDDTQKKLDEINEKMWNREKEIMELKQKSNGEMSETMQVANMQKEMFTTGLQQVAAARRDLTRTILILSGKGKPAGADNVEQWSDEELKMFEG